SLERLAALQNAVGNYSQAAQFYERALDIRKQALGEKDSTCADTLNSLAIVYTTLGDYARAEPLLQQALDINQARRGMAYATSLFELGVIYTATGEPARAEPLYLQALDVLKGAGSAGRLRSATYLDALARLKLDQNQPDWTATERLYRQAA